MAIACKPQLLIADEPTTFRRNRSKEIISCWRHSARNGNEYYIYFTWFVAGFRDCPSGFSDVPGEIVEQGSKTNFKNPVHNYTKL
jgi:ABC-type dipeptide/oligopeptide/nickel transport system ATPase component